MQPKASLWVFSFQPSGARSPTALRQVYSDPGDTLLYPFSHRKSSDLNPLGGAKALVSTISITVLCGALHCTLCHDHALAKVDLGGPIVQVDEQLPVQHEEKLVIMVVLTPMKFSLHYPGPNHTIISPCKGFIKLIDQHGTPPYLIWISCGNSSNNKNARHPVKDTIKSD